MPQLLELTSPLPAADLRVAAMSFQEGLGIVGEITLDLFSRRADLDPRKLLGQNLTVSLALREGAQRHINGYVTRLWQSGHRGRHHAYQATLRPWLWFLSRRTNCRVFQELTVPQIVAAVFEDHAIASFDASKLFREYRKWDCCVQYRETDLAFVSRLLEHEGIYYFFEHAEGSHKLVLMDSASAHDTSPDCATLPFIGAAAAAPPDVDFIDTWTSAQSVRPGKVLLWDHDFERPSQTPEAPAELLRNHALDDHEVFDYPGGFTQTADGEHYALTRIEELQARFDVHEATSNVRALHIGELFKLQRHFRSDQNNEYLVTSTALSVGAGSEESGDEVDDEVQCRFSAIPSSQQYRPVRRTRKPFVQGPQTAVVVGPKGKEIFTDKYGRVKLQFHWDRLAKKDDLAERSSCWVRVSQPWAGKNFGAMFMPRTGQEVIVDFLEGDPDQPVVIGRVYNAEQMPPWELPANATQSGVRTRSSPGGAYENANEIKFEDKKGEELLSLHAERNMSTSVEADESISVGHDRSVSVKNHDTLTVDHGREVTIKADGETYLVTGTRMLRVTGHEERQVTAGRKTVITGAMEEFTDGARTCWNKASYTFSADRAFFDAGPEYFLKGFDLKFKAAGQTFFETGATHNAKAAEFKFSATGNINFTANQFNRTIFEGNDTVLGPNTNTYIGVSRETTMGPSTEFRSGMSNSACTGIAIESYLGMQVSNAMALTMSNAVSIAIENAGLNLGFTGFDLSMCGIGMDHNGLKMLNGGGAGAPGGAGLAGTAGLPAVLAAALGGSFALGFGGAAAVDAKGQKDQDIAALLNNPDLTPAVKARLQSVLDNSPFSHPTAEQHGATLSPAEQAAQTAKLAEGTPGASPAGGDPFGR